MNAANAQPIAALPPREAAVLLPCWLVGLCLLISFCGIFNRELWTPDEPREAAIILAMSRAGHDLVPQLAGQPFVEKPPLYYLMSAGWLRLGGAVGHSAGWLRLSSALWGLGTLGMTFLLARRLYDRPTARLAVVILATMPGFIHVTHWLLVDNALMFFLVATCWALAAAYQGQRPGFLLLAGLFAAGAFLTKGLIGPAFVGLGWLGLFIPWRRDRNASRITPHSSFDPPPSSPITHHSSLSSQCAFHLLAALVFLAPVLAWAVAFHAAAGPALFMEWFWTNHVGRFSGAAAQLGHIAGPWYYLGALPVYVLPWLALLACGLGRAVQDLRARAPLATGLLLPLAWGLGGLLLLSLSATKREIYLSALLPALALLAAQTLRRPLPRWADVYQRVATLILLLAGAAALVAVGWLAAPTQAAAGLLNSKWVWLLTALLAMAAGLGCWRHPRLTVLARAASATALAAIALLTLAGPTLDPWKNYGPAFTAFARELQAQPALRPAAWDLDETTRAGFYWYTGRIFPALRAASELQDVLQGRHPSANAIVRCRKDQAAPSPGLDQARVLIETPMGPRRTLQLLAGPVQGQGRAEKP